MMPFEIFLGRRYLRPGQKLSFISLITFLSIAGVTVGVMALIIVIGVMAGFESDLKGRILNVEPHITITCRTHAIEDADRIIREIREIPDVTNAEPLAASQIMIRSNVSAAGAMIKGIDPQKSGAELPFLDKRLLAPPTYLDATAGGPEPPILIGRELARSLGVIPGDRVYLISPRGMLSPIGHVPAMKRFDVAGIFESGMYEYDGTLAYLNIDDARKFLRMGQSVSEIEVRVREVYRADRVAEAISERLGGAFRVMDWMARNQNFFSALKLEKTAMFLILCLIVLVAAFNIASSLFMTVMEKTRDIGILKAMGATDRSIARIFTFKGTIIGVIGTLLGGLLGGVLCALLKRYRFIELPADVYYITTVPVRITLVDIAVISLCAVAICLLSTLYPARQAAKLNPTEALRHG